MQLITTESDEIDITSSIHDSFINMTNNDEALRADVGLNSTESLDHQVHQIFVVHLLQSLKMLI